MEPMMPAKVEPLKNPSVKKFHDRFGQHFHSIAWYVDDVEAISERLNSEDLRLFNIVGKVVKPPHKMTAIWTHPKETSGQLEFAAYGDFIPDPRMESGWSSTRAAGPVPSLIASARTDEDELEPRPWGIATTLPASDSPNWGWARSLIVPVSGSNPPQNESPSLRRSNGAEADPETRNLTTAPRW